MTDSSLTHAAFLDLAIAEARQGRAEGGIPIGAVLVLDGQVIGRGHNRRVQKGSPILHGEMDCLENAGRRPATDYHRSVLYTTLSPCAMCTGAILLFGIPTVVIGENRTFTGREDLLTSAGVALVVLQNEACIAMMTAFKYEYPRLWNEDIAEPS
jgi:cytosine/creatinine deaminase